ncbi:MAG: membrane protein insertion efficiency factor [Christensenellales bacterium]
MEAVRVHGPFKGMGMALWRICRCNPFSKGGYDPVPQKKNKGNEK